MAFNILSLAQTGVARVNTQSLLASIVDPFGVYCVLEVCDRSPQGLDSNSLYHVFPVMPEVLSVSQRYLQSITPTLNGLFVDDYGIAPSPIILRGTFGRFPRAFHSEGLRALVASTGDAATASDLTLGRGLYTGYQATRLMSEMVARSHQPDENGNPRIAKFYNFAFGGFYEVALNTFDASMTVQQNNLWQYTLSMTVLRPLASFTPSISTRSVALRTKIEEITRRQSEEVKKMTGDPSRIPTRLGLDITATLTRLRKLDKKITTGVRSITRLSPGELIRRGAGYLDEPLGLESGTTFEFFEAARKLPSYVLAVVNAKDSLLERIPNDIKGGINDAKRRLAQIHAAIDGRSTRRLSVPVVRMNPVTWHKVTPGSNSPVTQEDAGILMLAEVALEVEHALNGIEVMLADSGLTIDSLVSSESLSLASQNSLLGTEQLAPSSRKAFSHTVRQGDTLSRLSDMYYGSPDQWPTIVRANPTVFGTGSVNAGGWNELIPDEFLTGYVGDMLTIPRGSIGAQDRTDPNVLDAGIGERALGTDLASFVTTEEIEYNGVTYTTLAVLSPVETLLQGIENRLSTAQGSVADFPSFGSQVPALLGEAIGPMFSPLAAAKVEEALRQEPRLTEVRNVQVITQGSLVAVQFQASVINKGSLGLVEATLDLQEE